MDEFSKSEVISNPTTQRKMSVHIFVLRVKIVNFELCTHLCTIRYLSEKILNNSQKHPIAQRKRKIDDPLNFYPCETSLCNL